MSVERNVATYRRWFDEGCSQGHVDLADDIYAPDYVTHALGPGFPPTLAGLKAFIRALREGMPDLRCPVQEVVGEGDRVGGRLTLEGTHTGPLFGMPPGGRHAAVGLMVIARFDERGRWVEDWANWDQLGFLQQLGAIPEPARA